MKKVLLLVVFMFSAISLTACGEKKEEKKDPIVGTWEYTEGYKAVFVFNEDGTGTYTLGTDDAKQKITYTKDDKEISITYGDSTVPFKTEYRIEDDTFILIDSLGSEVKYKKK